MTRSLGVVVIGASSGFGAALALDLAAAEHNVVAGARRLPAGSPRVRPGRVDVTSAESVADFAAFAVGALGRLDGLVYCAADPGAVARAWQISGDDLAHAIDVSLLGFVRVVGHLVPVFQRAGRGSIVTVGSRAARAPVDLLAGYGAAKAALEHYTVCLAAELHGTGIRANVIGIAAETPLAVAHRTAKEHLRGTRSSHPPLPPVIDSVPVARWLLSDDARHVSGQIIEARQP